MQNNCKNCNTKLHGKFCHNCGQKIITTDERTLKHLFEEFFHYFTHLDSKFLKTLKAVVFKTGQVSRDIADGITVKYFKISTFFLLGALLYFLIPQNFIGYGFLNTPFKSQINSGLYREWKEKKTIEKTKALHMTKLEYAIDYNKKLQNNGKLLTLLLIPLTIPVLLIINLLLKIINRNHQFTAYDLAINSLEINSAFLYVVFLIFGIIISIINYFIFQNLEYEPLQKAIIVIILFIVFRILYSFFKIAYQLKWFQAVACTILFCIGYTFVAVFYQLFSFIILY